MRLVLASNSESRKRILTDAGFRFLVAPSNIDETSEATDHYAWVKEVATKKAQAIAKKREYKNDLIVAADTVVLYEGERIGKPKDEEDARRILHQFSGVGHTIATGLALLYKGSVHADCSRASIAFHELEESDIEKYLKTGEWQGRAGAYAGQGKGAILINHSSGDYLSMAGFPLQTFYELLAEKQIDPYDLH